jgi:hypothetical protein
MSIKAAVSAVALASAMLVAPAFAQDAAAPSWTISGNAVAEQDQAAVQARCDDLQIAKDTQSLTQESNDDEQATGDQADAGAVDAGTINDPATDSETATTIDLSTITLEDCEAGGWYAAQ